MSRELTPAPVDLASADREFWARFHVLRRKRHGELRPDEPPQPDREVEVNLKRDNPFEFHHWHAITAGGELLSTLHAESIKPANPEYETNKQYFWADAYVDPERRRERIATAWLPVVAQLMDACGATVLGLSAELDSGNAFLRWLGAEPKITNIESRLKLSGVDWAMLERWVEEGARRSPSTALEVYDGRIPDELLPEVAPQLSALLNTMPREDLDRGDTVFTVERMRDWHERMDVMGAKEYTVLTREPNGLISGLTSVTWAPHRRRVAYQEFTGVRPDARGRGIGKWIKAAMLLHLRELHPELESVITDNAQSNAPMLAINRALGFEPYRRQIEYQMSRAELERKISL